MITYCHICIQSLLLQIIFIAFIKYSSTNEYDLDFCKNNEHVSGYWRFDDKIHEKLHECCTIDEIRDGSQRKQCSSQAFNKHFQNHYNGSNLIGHGRLVKVQNGARACDCDNDLHSLENITRREQYRWSPHTCKLMEWDSKLFCKLLGNRKVLLSGDSVMSLCAVTLMNMVSYHQGGCGEQISFTHRNFLTFHEKIKNILPDAVSMFNPDILIISVGAWLKDKGDMLHILSDLSKQIDMIRQNHQGIQIVWRSQIPGHYQCSRDEPFKPFRFHSEDKYKWNFFPLFDTLSHNFTINKGIKWLDMSPLYIRSDGHPGGADCLHFCIPGPIDLFPILLLQKMYIGEI